MGGFGLFLLLLIIAFVLYMIIGAALQVMKGASGLEVVLSEKKLMCFFNIFILRYCDMIFSYYNIMICNFSTFQGYPSSPVLAEHPKQSTSETLLLLNSLH